jgi:hypothetical protein
LSRPVRSKGRTAPAEVFLAAFGKHPGWEDHIEDLGLETDGLVAVRRALYVEGIGGNIDSGAWAALKGTQRLDEFSHLFFWHTPDGLFVGRMWSSTDAKGRTRYPMVLCAHCIGLPVRWTLDNVPVHLEEVQRRCVAVTAAADVRAIVRDARAELAHLAQSAHSAGPTLVVSPRILASLADHPDMGSDHSGMLRVLYQVEREMAAFRPGLAEGTGSSISSRSQHMRVPACASRPQDAVLLWLQFMLGEIDPATPVLMIAPESAQWVDIVVGDPTTQQFYCVLASLETIPKATEIPYTLEPDFIRRVEQRITDSRAGVGAARTISGPARHVGRPGQPAGVGSPRLSRVILLALALCIAGLAVVAVAVLRARRSGQTRPAGSPRSSGPSAVEGASEPDPWQTFCTESFDWFGLLLSDLDDARRRAWRADPHLGRVIGIVEEAEAEGIELDPRDMAGSRLDLRHLANHPPEPLRTPEGVARARRAADIVAQLRTALSPEGWPLLAEVDELAGRYEERGWLSESAYLGSLADRVTPGLDVRVAAGADELVGVRALVEEIEQRWTQLAVWTATIEAAGDEVLAGFSSYVRAATASGQPTGRGMRGDLVKLQSRLDPVHALAEKLAAVVGADWPRAIAHEEFRSGRDLTFGAGGMATAETYRDWLQQVHAYYRLPAEDDPRDGLEAVLASVGGELAQLETASGAEPPPQTRDRLAELESQTHDLLARPWIRRYEAEVGSRAADVRTALRALRLDIQMRIAESSGRGEQTLDELRAALTSRDEIAPSGSPLIDETWRAQRDALLASATGYGDLHAKAAAVQEFLCRLDEELPVGLAPEAPGAQWQRALAGDVTASRRDGALEEVLAVVRWEDGVPVADDPEYDAQLRRSRSQFEEWCADARELTADFAILEGLLDHGYGLEDDAGKHGSVARLYAPYADTALLREPDARGALQPILERIERLRHIQEITSRRELVRLAQSQALEAALAAWRRLAELPWPPDHQALLDELSAQDNVRSLLKRLSDGRRRTALAEELAAGGRARWQQHFEAVRRVEDVEAAIELIADFGVDHDELPPWAQYNVLLYDFCRDLASRELWQQDQLASRLGRFRADVEQLDGASRTPAAADLLRALADAQEETATGRDLSGAGPGAAGWRMHGPDGGEWVEYSWQPAGGHEHALTFLRFAPADQSSTTFYLSTTEVSVGLFMDTVAAAEAWAAVRDVLPVADEYRTGTWAWEWPAGRTAPRVAASWLPAGVAGKAPYPDDLAPAKPSTTHPMHRVSPGAALYVAQRLGCRLPSPSEWRVAYDSRPDGAAVDAPNLRDSRWDRQRRHAAALEEEGRAVDYPDADVFWPDAIPRNRRKQGPGAEPRNDEDDGFLWFATVDEAGRPPPRHLVGNVAELVFTPADAGPEAATAASPKLIADALASRPGSVQVVGGSALSPPDMQLDEPYPLDCSDPRRAFADVGFRLAFTAPVEPLAARLKRKLAARSYLTGPDSAAAAPR